MTFQDQNLHPQILKAIEKAGYQNPTPIQLKAIPKIMQGFDIRASANTGTGKTAAFLLPALNRLTEPSKVKGIGPRVLILVPTRELAMQVAAESIKYSCFLQKTKTVCIYGGAPYPVQNRELSRPHEILVATPGRLIDHMDRGRIDFSRLELLILDEADRMLDMGFIEPVEQIAAATPKTRQTLMFSATLKGNVMKLSDRLLTKPMEISVQQEQVRHENIEQRLHFTDDLNHKYKLLDHLLTDPTIRQAIVFTQTKRHADQLVDILYDQGHQASALHGDMNQRQRTHAINQMRQGKIRVLVATDVAARGIDVQTISHVINFDLPTSTEDYVHRIGRTGRAGSTGVAYSFAAQKDIQALRRIEEFTGHRMTPQVVPGLEPKFKAGAGKPQNKRMKRRGPPSGAGARGQGSNPGSGAGPRSQGSGPRGPGAGPRGPGGRNKNGPRKGPRFSRKATPST